MSLFYPAIFFLLLNNALCEYIPCAQDNCDELLREIGIDESTYNFENLECRQNPNQNNQTYCVEVLANGDIDWIWLMECTSDEECIKFYPGAPFCDTSIGKCTVKPNIIEPPNEFDPDDPCKVLYELDYVYDSETKSCLYPSCDVKKDTCPKPTACFRGFCRKTVIPPTSCRAIGDCKNKNLTCSQGQCEYFDCNDEKPCSGKLRCTQNFCKAKKPCTTHDNCSPGQKCVWGLCYDVIPSNQGGYGLVPCKSPLKDLKQVCRPLPCYSKKDCDKGEKCLKWPEFQCSGICYQSDCTRSDDCPAGMGCDQRAQTCVKDYCTKDNDCSGRFLCNNGTCLPRECTNDFECGYKFECLFGQCHPVKPPFWTDRPCIYSQECNSNNLFCFTLGENKLGTCLPYQCIINQDCPPWMHCSNGKCQYKKCSEKQPCPPGLTCGDGFCFVHSCASSYQCPPGFECSEGMCKRSEPKCIDDTYCSQGNCIDGIICSGCEDGERCENGREGGVIDSCQNCKGLCLFGVCYNKTCKSSQDCPFLHECRKKVCQPIKNNIKCEQFHDCPSGQMCLHGYCLKNQCLTSLYCPPGSECYLGNCTWPLQKECKDSFDCNGNDVCAEGKCLSVDPGCKSANQCPPGLTCSGRKCSNSSPRCGINQDCLEGQLCILNRCFSPPRNHSMDCYHDMQCPSQYSCQNYSCKKCQEANCQESKDCSSDEDCDNGQECLSGQCISVPTLKTSSSTQSPRGETTASTDIPDSPSSQTPQCQCDPKREKCLLGNCYPLCFLNSNCTDDCNQGRNSQWCYRNCTKSPCKPDEICIFEACYPKPDECNDEEDCTINQTCFNGHCYPSPPCNTLKDCPDGSETCHEGICCSDQFCSSNEDCYSKDVCHLNKCRKPCINKKDCLCGQLCQEKLCTPKKPCLTDEDCSKEEVCFNHQCKIPCKGSKCSPQFPQCHNDEDCPDENWACTDELCVKKCQESKDCPKDLTCRHNMCVQWPMGNCSNSAECGVYADCIDKACQVQCGKGYFEATCGESYVCINGICSPGENTCNNEKCPEGKICINNLCLDETPDKRCALDKDCDDEEICQDDLCVPIPTPPTPGTRCKTDDDCPDGQSCENDSCTGRGSTTPRTCAADKDCDGEEICQDDFCISVPTPTDEPACKSDKECPDGQICKDNLCMPIPTPEPKEGCGVDEDCPDGMICRQEQCTLKGPLPCSKNKQCGPSKVCENRRCVIPCKKDVHCKEGRFCWNYTSCSPDPGSRCNEDIDCGSHGECVNDECHYPCNGQKNCPSGYECSVQGFCKKLPGEDCDNDAQCGLGAECIKDRCVQICRSDRDCDEGQVCFEGACHSRPWSNCTKSFSCGPNGLCDENRRCIIPCLKQRLCPKKYSCIIKGCAPTQCDDEEDCSPFGTCIGGRCSVPCALDGSCPPDFTCSKRGDKICQPDKCYEDFDCGPNGVCEGRRCVYACKVDKDCPSSKVCDPPKCVAECKTRNDCKNGNFVCKNGHCLNFCTTKADCPDKPSYVKACLKKECHYIKVGCDTDDHCSESRKCIRSKCLKVDCTSNIQCKEAHKNEGLSCIKGKCIDTGSCETTTYCKKRFGPKYLCFKGNCITVKVGCKNNNDNCLPGYQCYKDKCIRIKKCEHSVDCPSGYICNEKVGKCYQANLQDEI